MTTDEGAAKAHNSDAGNSAASKAAPPAHEPGQPSDKAARAIAEGLMVLPPGNGEPPLLKRRSQSAPRLAPLPDIPGQNAESAEVVPLIHEVKNLNDGQPHAEGARDDAREPDRVAHHPAAFRSQATPLPLQGEEVPARRRSAGISPNPVPEAAESVAPVATGELPPAPVSAGQPQAPQPSPPPGQLAAPPLQAIRDTLPEAPAARPAPVHPVQQASLEDDEPHTAMPASSAPDADGTQRSQQQAMQEEIRRLLQQEMRQITEHQARAGTAGHNEPAFVPPQYPQPMPMQQQAYPLPPGPNMQPVYQPQPLMPGSAQWAMHPYQAQQYYPAGMPGYAPAMPYQQPVPPQVAGYPSVLPGYAPQVPQPCPAQQPAQGHYSSHGMVQQQSPSQPMEQPPTQQAQTQPAGDAAAAESAHLLASLLQYLPPAGHFWSEADRENWLDAAATLFDLAYGDLGHSERRVAERHNGRKDVSYGHSGYRGR